MLMNLMANLRHLRRYLKAALWRQRNKNFLIIFNWHQVTPDFDPARHYEGTWTSVDVLAREIDYLATEFDIIPLHRGIKELREGGPRGRCVSLTFDDGDQSVAEYVEPLLRQRGLPATFFINSAYFDGNRSAWSWILADALRAGQKPTRPLEFTDELLEKARQLRHTKNRNFYNEVRKQVERLAPLIPSARPRLVSTDWLKSLDGQQLALGAHGHEHQRFSMMSAEWQQSDLLANMRFLSQFHAFRPILALPFGREGDWTEETLRIAHDQGLEVALADGGINTVAGAFFRRIPGDARRVRPLIIAAMAAR
jgi:peptidoglycan/xylan/chitin deacetylase (PgdA/CDA1 family)